MLGGVVIGGLFAFTVWFSKRARRLGETRFAEIGVTFPSVAMAAEGGEAAGSSA